MIDLIMSVATEKQLYENPEMWIPQKFDQTQDQRARHAIAWLPPSIASVLDVGCGNGILINQLKNTGLVVGTDRSWAALQWVQAPCCQGDALSLPFKDGAFDVVLAMEIIEHIPFSHFNQSLTELARVARHYIFISVPYQENDVLDMIQVRCPVCGCLFHVNYHMRSFYYPDLDQLFREQDTIVPLRIEGVFSKRMPRFPRSIRMIRQQFQKQSPVFPPLALCPQCGFFTGAVKDGEQQRATDTDAPHQNSNDRGVLKKYLRTARATITNAIWPAPVVPRWWFALYEKKAH